MGHRIEQLAEGITFYPGDCLGVLPTLAENIADSCVTDPPYHLTSGNLAVDWGTMGPNGSKRPNIKPTNASGRGHKTGFMGKEWDGGDIAFRPDVWREVFRVLKPGAHLLAFGGTRTYHRMACAIEDAGFEIRDSIQWLYGSGFPKSLDVSKAIDKAAGAEREKVRVDASQLNNPPNLVGGAVKGDDRPWRLEAIERGYHEKDGPIPATAAAAAWDGWGTALKPACEPIVLARKPLSESTVAANVLKWGTGALNIDGCRVATDENLNGGTYTGELRDPGEQRCLENRNRKRGIGEYVQPPGRWPANVIHDGSDEVVGAFPETTSGLYKAGSTPKGVRSPERRPLSPQRAAFVFLRVYKRVGRKENTG